MLKLFMKQTNDWFRNSHGARVVQTVEFDMSLRRRGRDESKNENE